MIRATNQMSVRVRGEEDGSVAPGAALRSAPLRSGGTLKCLLRWFLHWLRRLMTEEPPAYNMKPAGDQDCEPAPPPPPAVRLKERSVVLSKKMFMRRETNKLSS